MAHCFEPATSGRATCRGCGQKIVRGVLRFGERLPNPFAEGEMTHWYHPLCAAYKRPESMAGTLSEATADVPERDALERASQFSLGHRRLPRIDGAERAPSGQARCRSCRESIPRGTWRVRLVFYQDGRFSPSGFVHLACRDAYFETPDISGPVLHFSPGLEPAEREELLRVMEKEGDRA